MEALKRYSFLEHLQLLLLFAFVSTITLNQKLNSTALFTFIFSLLFSIKFSNFKTNKWPILIFTAGFLLSLTGLLYSPDSHEGKLVIERQLALLFIPLLWFAAFKVDEVKFHMLLQVFFISITAVSFYLLQISYNRFTESHVLIKDWFVKDNLYHSFARPIGMHATYLSLYVGLGIFVGFYMLLRQNSWMIKGLVFLAVLVLVTTLTLLASRIVISSVLLILFIIYPFYIGKLKYKFFLILAGLVICLISFFLVRESSFISDRFIDKIGDEIKLKPFLKPDSTYNPVYGGETRADRWFCAVELIKEKPVLGYGTGSEKEVLMQKYEKYNLQNAIINNYDAHNQYLAFSIKSGLIGFFIFLTALGYAFYISIRNKSFLYLSFIVLFTVTCITENVLESNKGIFFYAFFNVLFCSYCLAKPEDAAGKKSPDFTTAHDQDPV